ncbi:MAG: hypothetical protein V3V61_01755 [Gammaproteobacteria bacterium]
MIFFILLRNQQQGHSHSRFYSRSDRHKQMFFTRSKKLRRFVESNPNSDSIVLERFIALSDVLSNLKIPRHSEKESYEHDLVSFKRALDPKEKSIITKGVHVAALGSELLELSASGANELVESLMLFETLAGGAAVFSIPLELYKNYRRFNILKRQISAAQAYKISVGRLNGIRDREDSSTEQKLLEFICRAEGGDSKNDGSDNELKAPLEDEPIISTEGSDSVAAEDDAITPLIPN